MADHAARVYDALRSGRYQAAAPTPRTVVIGVVLPQLQRGVEAGRCAQIADFGALAAASVRLAYPLTRATEPAVQDAAARVMRARNSDTRLAPDQGNLCATDTS
jgi:hypothetical protein